MTENMSTVHIRVTVAGKDFDLVANTADLLTYEQAAYQQHFPPMDKGGQFTFTAFTAWAAARRTGQTDLKWSEWRTQIEHMEPVDEEPVDPTEPAPAAG